MIACRFLLLAVAFKYLKVSKIYLHYQMIFLMICFSLPQDYGNNRATVVTGFCYLSFIVFSFNFWAGLSTVSVVFVLISILSSYFIYDEPISQKMLIPFFFNFLCLCFYSISVFAAISWCGELYLKLDIFNLKDNSLLENLKEGVYILDENTKFVLFQNKMAKKYNVLLQQSFSARELKESDVLDISRK